MSNAHFNGWDWRELAEAWNIYIPSGYCGKDMYVYAEKCRLQPDLYNKRTYTVVHDDGTEEVKLWSDLFKFKADAEFWNNHGYEPFEEYDPVLWYINVAMRRYSGNNSTRVMRKMAKDIRSFLVALSEGSHSYQGPLWEGLAKVENDFTLLQLVSNSHPLLAAMWD